jgi:hypothetical protein
VDLEAQLDEDVSSGVTHSLGGMHDPVRDARRHVQERPLILRDLLHMCLYRQ